MSRKLLLLMAAALVVSCAQANDQVAAKSHVGHLSCGGATLTAETTYVDIDDQDRQTLSQRITLTRPELSAPVVLPGDGRPLHQPFLKSTQVLDAAATGWACLATTDGKAYVYVIYTCVESPSRPQCEGDRREWVRLFDVQGKPLNAGFPHEGPRTPALMKKLGLGRYVDSNVQLKDIDD